MALTIFPFKRFQDVLDSHTHFSDCENYKSEHFCFVTPTPEISDRVFRFYESRYDASNFEVITVSFFLKKLFQLFEINRPPVQKVDLMTHLCVVWKRYFPHEDFTKFFNTFELFTEWRSYSLDLALFDPLMTSLDDVTKKAIQIFWIYCRDADFLDEHGTYKELESFLSENSKSKNTITKSFCENTGYENFTIKRDLKFIFYGFTHLTALQIDFLKTLGGMFEVVLPVPIILFKKQILKHSDWPNWFSDVFDVHSLSEDIDTDKTTLKYSVMNLSEQQIMYQKLREELSIGKDLGKDSTKYIKIIFGSEWSYSDLAIYHLPHDQATLDENIFVMEYVEFENNLDTFWSEIKKNQDSSGTLNVSLIDLEKESLVWYTQSLLHQKWRLAKVYELFLEALSDLRDVVGEVDNFYLKLLKIRVQLNLPRNKSIIGKNYGLEKIDNESIFWCPNFSNVNKVLIHIGEGFLEMRRGSARYTSETFKVLSGIGPIQRGALRFEWLFVSMLQITHSHSQFHLVFESLEVKNSFEKFMNEIIPSVSLVEEKFYFHNINMNVVNFQTQFSQGLLTKKINFHHSALHVKKPLSNSLLTPTKIQKYIDCPRSYYATYMMPVKAEVKNPFRMEKFEVGNIEHQVIQEYFTNYHEVDDQKLLQICQESLRAFELKSKKNLDD